MTTFEEAKRCPKCGQPGEIVKIAPLKSYTREPRQVTRGADIHSAECRNPRCKWYGTIVRTIQVNPDGTIPEPVERREKAFPAIPDLTETVQRQLDEQFRLETQGGGEVSRR